MFTSNIISLDEIADADYEMNNRLQEQESEDYYEHIVKGSMMKLMTIMVFIRCDTIKR